MSSYSDALDKNPTEANECYHMQVLDKKIKNKMFDTMTPQPLDYLIDQKKWIVLLICFIFIFIYYGIISISFSMIRNISTKHEYFNEHLKIEREQINAFKYKLNQMKDNVVKNLDTNDTVCHQIWSSIYILDFNYLTSHVLENAKPIKKSYDNTLLPLQYFLMLIYYVNTISISVIFKEPFRLFFLSTLFAIINLFVHAEICIRHIPNVYYTLVIAIWICLLSIYIVLKILITLLTIINYQTIKHILENE